MNTKSIKIISIACILVNVCFFSLNGLSLVQASSLHRGKILFMIPPEFNYYEFNVPKIMFEEWGYDLTYSALDETEEAYNVDYELNVNITVHNLENISLYDCVYVVGSIRWVDFGESQRVQELLIEANESELLIAAICSSTYVLGCAGLINGKNVTGYDLLQTEYEAQGATYINSSVVVDGRIITADYPYWTQLSEEIHFYLNPATKSISGYSTVLLLNGLFLSMKFLYERNKRKSTSD